MALQSYLEARTDKPTVVNSLVEADGTGVVTAEVGTGEAFLKDAGGKVFRLRWAKDDEQLQRRLPTGTYTLSGYRIVRGDWHISANGGRKQVVVQADRPLVLDLPAVIKLHFRTKPKRGKLMLQMGIGNGQHMGVSIYQSGKRIPIAYKLLGAGDTEVGAGSMNYG